MVEIVTEGNFKEFVKEGIVVVDCFASWCPPCQMLVPVIEKLAQDFPGIKFGKCDTDECQAVCDTYEIKSIPNILVFKDGNLIEQIVGFYPEEDLKGYFTELTA